MWYAKSEVDETIREHTNLLLDNYEILKNSLKDETFISERLWELLKIAVEYHDIGKFDLYFQNNIHEKKGFQRPFENERTTFVPHNYLSVLFIPFEELNLTKEEEKLLIQAVGYHHEREEEPDREIIKRIIKEELLPYCEEIVNHMKIPIAREFKFLKLRNLEKRNRITPYNSSYEYFTNYVLLKGFLHRLDHSASAYVPVEVGIHEDISSYVNRFFNQRPQYKKRPLQIFAEQQKDKHVIAIAQTGMGKTEASLLWAGNKKTFFTLPLRVSLNAMYLRIIDKENVAFPEQYTGLLHSSSDDILEEQKDEMAELLRTQSQNLSSKLLFTTIDQILKFPFYYRGFEKELSAMAGAKVIIDEMQAYDPKIAAMLIRALELIDQVGGTFMIMTATMPAIYLNAIMSNKNIQRKPVIHKEFYDDASLRHCVKIIEQSILDNIDFIAKRGREKKVLVICNTVQRAKDVYNELENEGLNVKLLHSLYMPIHRRELEKNIKKFADESKEPGIWVTTQLVEASIDIDFDELHTEFSTLDSQFQRYGRCYRKRERKENEPNIFVYTKDLSDKGFIYREELLKIGLGLLKAFDGQLLKESEKMKMVETLYSEENLQGTKFLQEFQETREFFKSNSLYEIKKKEAQNYLRDIRNVKVLPYRFDKVHELIDEYNQSTGKERYKIRKELEKYAISVNKYRVKNILFQSGIPASLKDFYFIESEYEFDEENLSGQGLIIDKVEQSHFS